MNKGYLLGFTGGVMFVLIVGYWVKLIPVQESNNPVRSLTPSVEVSVPLTPMPRLGYIEGQPKKIVLSLRPGETAVPVFRIVSMRARQYTVYGQPPCAKTEWMTQSGGTVEGRISEILISAFQDAKSGTHCHWMQAVSFSIDDASGLRKETEIYYVEIELFIKK